MPATLPDCTDAKSAAIENFSRFHLANTEVRTVSHEHQLSSVWRPMRSAFCLGVANISHATGRVGF